MQYRGMVFGGAVAVGMSDATLRISCACFGTMAPTPVVSQPPEPKTEGAWLHRDVRCLAGM